MESAESSLGRYASSILPHHGTNNLIPHTPLTGTRTNTSNSIVSFLGRSLSKQNLGGTPNPVKPIGSFPPYFHGMKMEYFRHGFYLQSSHPGLSACHKTLPWLYRHFDRWCTNHLGLPLSLAVPCSPLLLQRRGTPCYKYVLQKWLMIQGKVIQKSL